MAKFVTAALCMAAGVAILCLAGGQGNAQAVPTATSAPAGPVKVAVARIDETRSKEFVKSDWGSTEGTKVQLNITGGELAEVKRFGQLKVTAAVDDLKTDMIPKDSNMAEGSDFQTVDQFGQVKGGFHVDVNIRLAARAAKSIAKLVGSVTAIVGGKETAVDVKDVAKSAGKTLDDPVLKKAGITIKILDRKKASGEDGADKNIAYTIEGDTGMLLKVELIDSKGAPVPSQSGRSKVNDEPWIDEIMAENNGKLPDGAGLKVTVLAGAKTVKVPIELKDIPLP